MKKEARDLMAAQAVSAITRLAGSMRKLLETKLKGNDAYAGIHSEDIFKLMGSNRNDTHLTGMVRKLVAHREDEMVRAYNNQMDLLMEKVNEK